MCVCVWICSVCSVCGCWGSVVWNRGQLKSIVRTTAAAFCNLVSAILNIPSFSKASLVSPSPPFFLPPSLSSVSFAFFSKFHPFLVVLISFFFFFGFLFPPIFRHRPEYPPEPASSFFDDLSLDPFLLYSSLKFPIIVWATSCITDDIIISFLCSIF